jgi:tetratricopeptide (TPR) repeat protein
MPATTATTATAAAPAPAFAGTGGPQSPGVPQGPGGSQGPVANGSGRDPRGAAASAPARTRRLPLPHRLRVPPRAAAPLLAAAVLLTSLLAAWVIWQPERSDRASDRALALLADNRLAAASEEVRHAREVNPLSPKPLLVTAAVEDAAGRRPQSIAALERAVTEFPADPQVWLRLANFQLHRLDRPDQALETLKAAFYLDPLSPTARAVFLEAQQRRRAKQLAADAARGGAGIAPGIAPPPASAPETGTPQAPQPPPPSSASPPAATPGGVGTPQSGGAPVE